MKCGNCGQELKEAGEYHTHEHCLLNELNKYREVLGKKPIEVDIKAEDG